MGPLFDAIDVLFNVYRSLTVQPVQLVPTENNDDIWDELDLTVTELHLTISTLSKGGYSTSTLALVRIPILPISAGLLCQCHSGPTGHIYWALIVS